MAGSINYDFDGRVSVISGACGVLGSAAVERFREAGSTVCAVDVVDPDEDAALDRSAEVHFYRGDLTDESDVESLFERIDAEHGRLDHLLNVAGTWRGGTLIDRTDREEYDLVLDVNLTTAFLASKHAVPRLRETDGAIVNVSARASLEGGSGDGPYRISKAGIRLLTETLAEENRGEVRANCVMPSVIDTPTNREMMPDADHDEWVDPRDIADVMAFLVSDGASVTSGAAVPVYGRA